MYVNLVEYIFRFISIKFQHKILFKPCEFQQTFKTKIQSFYTKNIAYKYNYTFSRKKQFRLIALTLNFYFITIKNYNLKVISCEICC